MIQVGRLIGRHLGETVGGCYLDGSRVASHLGGLNYRRDEDMKPCQWEGCLPLDLGNRQGGSAGIICHDSLRHVRGTVLTPLSPRTFDVRVVATIQWAKKLSTQQMPIVSEFMECATLYLSYSRQGPTQKRAQKGM